MLKIRLTRRGKKNSAFFRVVVAEHTSPIKGKFLENLGFLNPHTKEKEFKADRIKYWIEKGAQCSDTVHNLLVSNGVVNGPKRAIKQKKKVVEAKPEDKKEETKEVVADEAEKKPAEAKEEKKIEDIKSEPEAKKKEEKKSDEEKVESSKPELEKKEAEPASSAGKEEK